MSMKEFKIQGVAEAREPYHYKACGLDDVYLFNGFTVEETNYGRGMTVHNAEALHRAIATYLINDHKPLSAREFRFLRKQMEFTQEDVAKRMRVDVQTIARYEKDQASIPGAVDAVMRILVALYLVPEDKRLDVMTDVLHDLEDRAGQSKGAMYFRQTVGEWDLSLQ
jgi:transcriptional regulator with XRE-family HTH domain